MPDSREVFYRQKLTIPLFSWQYQEHPGEVFQCTGVSEESGGYANDDNPQRIPCRQQGR